MLAVRHLLDQPIGRPIRLRRDPSPAFGPGDRRPWALVSNAERRLSTAFSARFHARSSGRNPYTFSQSRLQQSGTPDHFVENPTVIVPVVVTEELDQGPSARPWSRPTSVLPVRSLVSSVLIRQGA